MQQYTRLSPDGAWSEMVSFDGAKRHLFSDLDEADARWAFDHLCLEPLSQLAEPVSVPSFWRSYVARSYIVCTQDRAYPIDYMYDVARILGVEPMLMDSGHFPMINRPRETAALLVRAAAQPAQ
jgi:hypothetical protein